MPVIVITAYGSIESAVSAIKSGAFDYITKPFDEESLKITIRKALEIVILRETNRNLRKEIEEKYNFSSIMGESQGIVEAIRLASEVAPTDTTVLILGETGTGKEILTRAIHLNSRRKNGPFIAINCAAIPHELLESELFGAEKGAYTGAYARKTGKLERAKGGTFFLDEIGDMPLSLQAKLLRVIQEKEFERVGGNETIKADFRLICASNTDIEEKARKSLFRTDLYYRISVFPVKLPPLRERGQDVLLLAGYFLKKFSNEIGKQISVITERAKQALLRHAWTGNIRELQNIIERGVILCSGKYLDLQHVPSLTETASRDAVSETDFSLPDQGINIYNLEKSLIIQALKKSSNNKNLASRLLGMSRATLKYRMKKYGILQA
jgi:DNA-binding NtrC family response regulator